MSKEDTKQNLVDLLNEYRKYCKDQSAKLEKQKNDVHSMPVTFEGFIEWLETGEVEL